MRVGRQVERFQSRDGKHLLRLFSRGEGSFYFVELSEITEKGETFWTATQTSDDYPSLEEARDSAAAQYGWLKEAL